VAGRFGIFSIGLFACCLIAGGTAPAAVVNILPAGLADSNQTVDVNSIFHMPEPSTLFLVALGLVGIVGYGLRKRKKR
jgi:hypothetical protein